MSKGKEHKKYEFGTNVSITTTRDSKTIVGALAFDTNQYDGHTLPEVLRQLKRLVGYGPAVALCDRGYKGKRNINNTHILRPNRKSKETRTKIQELMRKRFRQRAGIEPVIGHLTSGHRLNRHHLKGRRRPNHTLDASDIVNFSQIIQTLATFQYRRIL